MKKSMITKIEMLLSDMYGTPSASKNPDEFSGATENVKNKSRINTLPLEFMLLIW